MREIYEESLQHLEESVLKLADEVYRTIEKSINVLSDDEKSVANEYISDASQLLAWGEEQLRKVAEPQINIEIDVVNFLQCLDMKLTKK